MVGETKTGAGTRKLLLPPSTAQLLREQKRTAVSRWMFPNHLHPERPVSPHSAYTNLKRLLKKADLPDIRFHDLRHPCVKQKTKILDFFGPYKSKMSWIA